MVNHRLQAADAPYHAFVGSRRKMAALREKLIAEGVDASAVDAMPNLPEIKIGRRRGAAWGGEFRRPAIIDGARQREPDSPATILSFSF
jgi:hypothetical protein